MRTLVPTQDSLWGLAELSREDAGRSKITEVLTGLPKMPEGYLTDRALADFAVGLLDEVGPDRIVDILGALYDLGINRAMRKGGSLNPFMTVPASLRGADATRDRLPDGYDVVSLVRILHDHDDATVRKLLAAARRSLRPGGTLLIAEPMAGQGTAGRLVSAYFNVYLLAMGSGRPRSPAELGEFLHEAGFRRARQRRTHVPMITGVLLATAPD